MANIVNSLLLSESAAWICWAASRPSAVARKSFHIYRRDFLWILTIVYAKKLFGNALPSIFPMMVGNLKKLLKKLRRFFLSGPRPLGWGRWWCRILLPRRSAPSCRHRRCHGHRRQRRPRAARQRLFLVWCVEIHCISAPFCATP